MENERRTTWGLRSRALIELLRIADDPVETPAPDVLRGEELEGLLAEARPRHACLGQSLPACIDRMDAPGPAEAGETLAQLFAAERADIYLIRTIKEEFKRRAAAEPDPVRRDALVVVYYAAIAQALVGHGLRLTRRSHGEMHQSLSLLLEKTWIDAALKELFQKACRLCQEFLDRPVYQEHTP